MQHNLFSANIKTSLNNSTRHFALRRLLPSPGNVVFTLLAVGALFWAQSAGAVQSHNVTAVSSSTNMIPYQGRLADANGAPLSGKYVVSFRLYSTASAGAPLWTENWIGGDSVKVSDGLFNVMLGSLTPIPQSVFALYNSLWLGMTVGTDDEMAPRVQLGSVPYTYQAQEATNADTLDGRHASELTPPGAIVAFAGSSAPAGWLLCDGSAVNRTQYAALFTAIGTAHGSGNGSTTFNLPDYRGRFLRGRDGGTTRDPDRLTRTAMNPGGQAGDNVGSVQADELRAHSHAYAWRAGTHTRYGDPSGEQFWYDYGTNYTSPTGGNETRPINAYVNWIIKY